ncbi:MAG TPA: heavy metal translocating P-type ATPase [Burkholderiales bacterium]|nr:heavy metal translocating P-type ATPase [Burkholderiales bacterium]
MSPALGCSHCLLPLGRLAQRREVNGEPHYFCCYGCCLAYQVHHGEKDEPEAAALLIRLGVGGFLAMNIMLFSLLLYSGTFGPGDGWMLKLVHWLLWVLATPLVIVLGGPFLQGAWQATLQRRVSTDTLVSVAVLAAYGYSAYQVWSGSGAVYFDTATMVLVLFIVGRYLEARARVQAARSLTPMLAADRAEARLFADGSDSMQPVNTVQAGAVVRILPGERIPVDGVVLEGRSECDEAILTGQSERQAKVPGAVVHAGSLNGRGQLLVRVTAAGPATRWAQIGRLVREALARKSLLGDTVDRLAAVFLPFVLLLAAGTVALWSGRVPFNQALMTGLAVLVVACPCSLGLAASLATTLGIALAARRGILVRGGATLERLARVKTIAFDKTGTLTQGRPRVVDLSIAGATEREVIRHAAALALASEHPLAAAIAELGRDRGVGAMLAMRAQAHPGAGIAGEVDGEYAALGSSAFMATLNWAMPPAWKSGTDLGGSTLVYVGWAGRVHARIALADTLLPDAARTVGALRARSIKMLLLSGDREAVVASAARALGIAAWRSELLPQGKVDALREWTKRCGPIAMVGDGLNDGPVLAAASVGIAVGAAGDLARESADIVLPERALESVPWVLRLATGVRRSVLANIAWALGYNSITLTLAAAGLLQPVVAAALMAGSSLLVATRSLRSHRAGAERAAVDETVDAAGTVVTI